MATGVAMIPLVGDIIMAVSFITVQGLAGFGALSWQLLRPSFLCWEPSSMEIVVVLVSTRLPAVDQYCVKLDRLILCY